MQSLTVIYKSGSSAVLGIGSIRPAETRIQWMFDFRGLPIAIHVVSSCCKLTIVLLFDVVDCNGISTNVCSTLVITNIVLLLALLLILDQRIFLLKFMRDQNHTNRYYVLISSYTVEYGLILLLELAITLHDIKVQF